MNINSDSNAHNGYINFECEKCGFKNKIENLNQHLVDDNKNNNKNKHSEQFANAKSHKKIPIGLEKFLLDFTIEILKKRPENLNEFAFDYFLNIKETQLMSADLDFKISLG